jgi:hypothetical protein
VGEPIHGQARDISMRGMGLYVPYLPPTPRVCLQFTWANGSVPLTLLAKVMSVEDAGDGRQAVGVFFVQNIVV